VHLEGNPSSCSNSKQSGKQQVRISSIDRKVAEARAEIRVHPGAVARGARNGGGKGSVVEGPYRCRGDGDGDGGGGGGHRGGGGLAPVVPNTRDSSLDGGMPGRKGTRPWVGGAVLQLGGDPEDRQWGRAGGSSAVSSGECGGQGFYCAGADGRARFN
jgi:hypothetical protein